MKKKSVVIYLRRSDKQQTRSFEVQKFKLEELAKRHGLNIVAAFQETKKRNLPLIERKEFLSCIAFCKAVKIDTILMYDFTRIGFEPHDLDKFVSILKENSLNVQFKVGDLTLSSMSKYSVNRWLWYAKTELELISERTTDGIDYSKHIGSWVVRKKMTNKEVLAKYPIVVDFITKGGITLTAIATQAKVSKSTVGKVKKAMKTS